MNTDIESTNMKKKIAFITGAGSGIGRAIALRLASLGADLCLLDLLPDRLDAVATLAKKSGVAVDTISVDLGDIDQIHAVRGRIEKRFGSLNILVHSAGIIYQDTIDRAKLDDFSRLIAVNVMAPYALTKDLLPLLRHSKGQIVFINSSVVANPNVGSIQYAATKHALKGIADGLRSELNEHGMRVLSIFPGRTATPMQERIFQAEGKEYRPERLLQPEDVAESVVNALRLPENAEVTDIHLRPAIKH
jgi:NADP-dependent 3-hydroxy acid dehydrogenase YdfG